MSTMLISIWIFLIYVIKVYLGFKIFSNVDSNLKANLFPKGITSILYIRLLNSKKLYAEAKMRIYSKGYNTLTYIIYGLIIINFFVILFKDNITINQ